MKLDTVAVVGLVTLLSGCVSVPPLKQPPATAVPASSSHIVERMPTNAEKYAATGLDGTYFGASGAKGSAAVGVLFGVIGVMGNIAHINSQNRQDAAPLGDLTSTNLGQLLQQQVATGPVATGGYDLVPAANLYFQDDKTYWLTCTLTAYQPSTKWQARYAITVDGLRRSDNSADTAAAKASLGPCLKDAYALFADHVGGKLVFEKHLVTSPRIDGKGDIELPMMLERSALPDRVISQDVLGLAQLRKDQIRSVK